MLQQRSLNTLKLLMGNKGITMEGLQAKTELSQRQIHYDIEIINDWLKSNNYFTITKKLDGSFLFKNNVNHVLKDLSKSNIEYILNEQERQKIIYLYLYLNYEKISLYHLIDLLEVSRGTVNSDLNKLKEKITKYNLSIIYTRDEGYYIEGEEKDIQYVIMLLIVKVILLNENNYIFQALLRVKDMNFLEKFRIYLSNSTQKNKLNLSNNNFDIISYIYIFYYIRGGKYVTYRKKEFNKNIEKLVEYQIAEETLEIQDVQNDREVKFLSSLLLSYSIWKRKYEFKDYNNINTLISNILVKLEKSYAINLNNDKVFKQLYSHIRPALFRMNFSYPMINPIKEEIMTKYKSIYIIIKEVLEGVDFDIVEGLAEDEIAYLTIHFAAFLSNDISKESKLLNGVVVCPSGIGISAFLQKELTKLFPEINFREAISINEINGVIDGVDMVFSTLLIETKKPLFLVNPIMNNIEKANLVNNVNHEFRNNVNKSKNVKGFINVIEKHTEIKDREGLIKEISNYFSDSTSVNLRRGELMLKDLINEKLIQTNVLAKDWKEAIRKSGAPLVENNKATENYVEAIIKSAEDNGPYMVITKYVALPHARPEDGALDVAISITTLKNPISFGNKNNDPVKYIFCLSAIDNTTHINALSELVDLLDASEFYELLDNTDDPKRILDYIDKHEN